MFSIAFFSLASLALSALATPLALPPVPDTVETKVDVAHLEVRNTVPDVPYVRRDSVVCLTTFVNDFAAPLGRLESIVNGATSAQDLAAAILPALGDLMTPMTTFVGEVVTRSGVSVQDTTVAVNTQQTVLTVKDYATRLTVSLSKASDLVNEEFPVIQATIQAVANMFSAVVYTISLVSDFTVSVLNPVLAALVPLVNKLGACATSSLGL